MGSPNSSTSSRREFLKAAALSTAALAVHRALGETVPAEEPSANAARLPRRKFGKTGVELSIIGLGGVLLIDVETERAKRLASEFVERGGNYFDAAPSYGDSEEKMGEVLAPHRKNVFLACKTVERRREGAAKDLKQSLERLRTDHFDLYQLHGIRDVAADVNVAFGKGGAMETLIEAKKSGQIRYLGFSAHSVDAAFEAMDRYDFDSILFPVNFATYSAGHFGLQIMVKALSKDVARLALKALARQKWPAGSALRKKYPKCWYEPLVDPREAELALRFTLSQDVTSTLPPGDESLFQMAMDFAMRFKPITEPELAELKALAENLDPIFRAT